MIHALRYEPQGHRQRYEPPEQQEQDRLIHLHLHLDLTFRARQRRSIPTPNATRIMRIFAALVAATLIPLWLLGASAQESMSPTLSWIGGIFLVGLTLAWGFGCLPLLVSAWPAIPRVRFLLLVLLIIPFSFSLLPFGLIFITLVITFFRLPGPSIDPLVLLLLSVHPLISAILLACVSREARALRQTAAAHAGLGFVIASGMVLMLLGGLLMNLFAMLSAEPPLQLLFLPAMCGAVIVAIYTLFGLFRSPVSTQARPKDTSPSDVDSPGEL